jgi:hypothetical protein
MLEKRRGLGSLYESTDFSTRYPMEDFIHLVGIDAVQIHNDIEAMDNEYRNRSQFAPSDLLRFVILSKVNIDF